VNYQTTLEVKLPTLLADYFAEERGLDQFYHYKPSLAGLTLAASDRSSRSFDRSVLVEVLREQALNSAYSTQRTLDQINALLSERCMTITTGHQLCLYGGPLYFFYKILSAIKLCEQMGAEDVQALPVFWMASEDHDFEEVNHIHLGHKKITWTTESGGPVGKLELQNLGEFREAVKNELYQNPTYRNTLHELDTIFADGKTLGEATRDFVYWIFADMGVVVIDADDPRLKKRFAPTIMKELVTSFSFEALTKVNAKLESKSYPIQVNGREINLFWIKDGLRERILKTDLGFKIASGKFEWTHQELLTIAEQNPEYFSPNVILRPVYQEVLLPNIAYVGGPGELSYWLQLSEVFNELNLRMPSLVLRDMVLLLDDKAKKIINQLSIRYSDLSRPKDSLFDDIVRQKGDHDQVMQDAISELESILDKLITDIHLLEPALEVSAKSEKTRILNRLEVLRKKMFRNRKRSFQVDEDRIAALYSITMPEGVPQERHYNWLTYFSEPSIFCNSIRSNMSPTSLGTKVFEI